MNDDPQPTDKPSEKLTIVIYPDADEHNANWLRLLAKRRQEQNQQSDKKEPHDNG